VQRGPVVPIEQVNHRAVPGVAGGADHTAGFVQHDIDALFRLQHPFIQLHRAELVDQLADTRGGRAVHQHPAVGQQWPDLPWVYADPCGEKAVESRATGAHALAQQVQGNRLCHLDAVDTGRQDTAGIPRTLAGGVEAAGIDALAVIAALDADGG
jgi:hypothetical protein